MDSRYDELADFLRTRRHKLDAADFGFEKVKRRRTPGLRREEVAQLANISTVLYTKLEQGQQIGVSLEVLESISDALALNEAERKHLLILAGKVPRLNTVESACPLDHSYQLILDSMMVFPAYILDPKWNIIVWNDAAVRVFGDFNTFSEEKLNVVWRVFMDPKFKSGIENWEHVAWRILSLLRAQSVTMAQEDWYQKLVSTLTKESHEFSKWWSLHDVHEYTSDSKLILHPDYGSLNLRHNTFEINGHLGFLLNVYVSNDCPATDAALKALAGHI